MTAHLYEYMVNTTCSYSFLNFKRDKTSLTVGCWRQEIIYWLCPPNSDKRRLGNGTGPWHVSPLWYIQKCVLQRTQPNSYPSWVNSYSSGWWCRGYALLTCSYLLHHAGNCWSSFLIYRDNIKWEHLLIHDSFITGLDSTLIMHTTVSVCCGLWDILQSCGKK